MMSQQFQDGQKDSDDLAAEIAAFKKFAEGDFSRFANPDTDPFDVNGNRSFVLTDAGCRLDHFLLDHT